MWQRWRTLCHSYRTYSYMHYINQRIHPLKYNEMQTIKYNYGKSWFVFCRILLSALCGWRSASRDSSTHTFFVALQGKSGIGRLIFNVSSSYTIRHKHTRPVGLLWTNNQLVAGPLPAQYITNATDQHHAISGFQTCDPGNKAASGLRLRQHGRRVRRSLYLCNLFI